MVVTLYLMSIFYQLEEIREANTPLNYISLEPTKRNQSYFFVMMLKITVNETSLSTEII